MLLIILISGFITVLISPLVNLMEKKRIHASITIIWIYLAVLLIAMIVVGTIIPIIITYITDTVSTVIHWANEAQSIYSLQWIKGFDSITMLNKQYYFSLMRVISIIPSHLLEIMLGTYNLLLQISSQHSPVEDFRYSQVLEMYF